MAKRTYLQDLSKTALHKRLVNAPCAEVRQLFMALSMRITRKALEAMYNDYNEHRARFDTRRATGRWVSRERLALTFLHPGLCMHSLMPVFTNRSMDRGGCSIQHKMTADVHFVNSG